MGRKVRESKLITNDYNRKITMRKRRIGLIKKAIQLSLLSGCQISLSIFCKEENSMMEYSSDNDPIKTNTYIDVDHYVKFQKKDLKLLLVLKLIAKIMV